MGLRNMAAHEDDPSYGYGPSPEQEAKWAKDRADWQAEWRQNHLIKVLFGDQVVECSLYIEVDEEKANNRYGPDTDIRSCHGPSDHEGRGRWMLVRISTKVLPEGFPFNDISFDGQNSDIEGFLEWDEQRQIYVPDERFMKNLRKYAKYVRESNPIEIDGEIYYFPIKNRREDQNMYGWYKADAHVNGQIFPVRKRGGILDRSSWNLDLS